LQVFISYSHNESDSPIAKFLAAGFRAAGYTVWHDESEQPAGEELQADIEQAVAASDAVIFIVSKLWLQSRWCKLELDRFDRRRDRVRRVPIFRLPYDQLRLPQELIDLKGITWTEEDAHHDARFWEVYVAVTGRSPGPRETWAAEGEKVQKGQVMPPVGPPPLLTLPSLSCDRDPQWGRLTRVTPEPSHDLLIVPGAVGQGHDHFSRRIREMLIPLPPRSIVTVHWRKRPSSRDEYFEAMATSMNIASGWLERELAERLSDSNLVLLHHCISARYVDPALVSYYTDWLPALITDVHPRMSLKCVQPVAWTPESGVVESVLTWLRLKPSRGDEGKPQAEALITAIRASAGLRGIRLQDLGDIPDSDLNEFCKDQGLTESQKAWFLAKVRARHPRNAEDLLASIDAVLPDARSVT
jgi:hypothetical protein